MSFWNLTNAVFRREFAGYFATPVAYVFIVIFLLSMGALHSISVSFFSPGAPSSTYFLAFIRGSICFCYLQFPCGFGRKNKNPARSNC